MKVTDAMVERACQAFYAPQNPTVWAVPPPLARNMRAALEASLIDHNRGMDHLRRELDRAREAWSLEAVRADDAETAARAFATAVVAFFKSDCEHQDLLAVALADHPDWLPKEQAA